MADELMIMTPGDIEPQRQDMVSVEESRAVAESQAGFVIAKRFPRDRSKAKTAIMRECESVRLAEEAEFSFPKGGKNVNGPTIRLLEVISQNWGNIIQGIRELEELEGESVLMAYCYDLETNTREERVFRVKHHIKLKTGKMKYLDDPRDLYELKFNMGSRRKRACMENIIPRHIIDEAVDVCRQTVQTKGTPPNEENINKMIQAFAEIGVSEDMLEVRQQKKLKAITGPEFYALRRIFKGIEDGMTTVEKVFGDESLTQPKEKKKAPPKAKAKAKAKPKAEKAPEPPEDPSPPPTEPSEPEASESSSEEKLPLGGEMVGSGMPAIQDQIQVVKFIKEGTTGSGNPWSLYHIETAGGFRLACFDKSLVERAENACEAGQLVEIEYKESEKGKSVIGIEIIG